MAKRACKREVRSVFKRFRKDLRELRKHRRKARFQKNWLPKIVEILKPSLLEALSKINIGGDEAKSGLRECKAKGDRECVPINQVNNADLLLTFMELYLNGMLAPHLATAFRLAHDQMWLYIDKLTAPKKDGITMVLAMQKATFLIPVFNRVWDIVRFIVNTATSTVFSTIRDNLQALVVAGVMKALTPVVHAALDKQENVDKDALAIEMDQTVAKAERDSLNMGASGLQSQASTEAQGAEESAEEAVDSIEDDAEDDEESEEDDIEDEQEEDAEDEREDDTDDQDLKWN